MIIIKLISNPQKADIKRYISTIPKLNVNLKKKSYVISNKGYIDNKNIIEIKRII